MLKIAILIAVFAAASFGQLKGIVDIHVHGDPDSMPRKIDVLEAARLGREEGMRALVLKNHYAPTAQLAYVVNRAVPGIEVYGGIVLNRSVGGINAEAVAQAAAFKGGYLRVVWMPTFDAENQVRFSKEKRPFVSVSRNGRLLPEVLEVLKVIAKEKLALATGHSSPAENLMLIREARRMGITRIVVTHPVLNVVNMSIGEMQEAAKLDALLEFCAKQVLPTEPDATRTSVEDFVKAIRAVGPEHCILSSDLGQPGNPVHTEGWKVFLDMLKKAGISESEIDVMARRNPARLVGLE
jgi:Family of unknown function (DUF6282)